MAGKKNTPFKKLLKEKMCETVREGEKKLFAVAYVDFDALFFAIIDTNYTCVLFRNRFSYYLTTIYDRTAPATYINLFLLLTSSSSS